MVGRRGRCNHPGAGMRRDQDGCAAHVPCPAGDVNRLARLSLAMHGDGQIGRGGRVKSPMAVTGTTPLGSG